MQLVFATNNLNKLKEVQLLIPTHIKLLGLKDIGCNEDIPETEVTIEGNAKLKSSYIKKHYGYDCFADDTGLEVPSLNNEPGVYSARYAGPENDAQANMNKLLKNLSEEKNRAALFKTAISLIFNGEERVFLGICEGEITSSQRGKDGFGYDPIFQPTGFNKTFAEMTLDQKGLIGHRGKAIRLLIKCLSE